MLKNDLKELSKIDKITINDKQFKLKFVIGGDMNFSLILFGLNLANAKYSCMYCTTKQTDFSNVTDDYKITRTIEQSKNIYNENHLKKKNIDTSLGVVNLPIFDFIGFDELIYDILHQFLRIPEKLLELFLNDLNELDKYNGPDLEKRLNLKAFKLFLEDTCRIQNPFKTKDSTLGRYELRSFRGEDIDKLLESNFDFHYNQGLVTFNDKIDSLLLLVNKHNSVESLVTQEIIQVRNLNDDNEFEKYKIQKFNFIKTIWHEYKIINNILKSIHLYNNEYLDILNMRLKNWLRLFLKAYHKQHITPYMHIITSHTIELLKKYKNLNKFNMQGLEKTNDVLKTIYYKKTNRKKKGKAYLKQLIHVRMREEMSNLDYKSLDEIENQILINKAFPIYYNKIISELM